MIRGHFLPPSWARQIQALFWRAAVLAMEWIIHHRPLLRSLAPYALLAIAAAISYGLGRAFAHLLLRLLL
jgi:hypothetical protein